MNDFRAKNLWEVFEQSAARFPGRPALKVQGESLSYAELAADARRYAAAIHAGSASTKPAVAFLAHRSRAAYSSVLGIAAAGKAYVPLQPKFPVERTLRMLDLSGADTLLIAPEGLERATELLARQNSPLRIIPVGFGSSDDLRRIAGAGHEIVEPHGNAYSGAPAEPDDYAYLLFTSGSTGVPKGVPIRQRNVLSYLEHVLSAYRLSESDVFSQTFDLTFDLSVHDMFVCWAVGAQLTCLPDSAVLAPGKFIRAENLTVWFSVPSVGVLMQRLRQLKPGAFPGLRVSLFCGEALPASIAAAWQEAAPNSILENLYGPTETTIAVSRYRWRTGESEALSAGDVTPIGHVFPTHDYRLVTAALEEAPESEGGELCIAGPQVSTGYWNDAGKTAEKFVQLTGDDRRWYRTGDIVRRTDGGVLLYCGRVDHQVQIMGHRVELQEVEHVLRRASDTEHALAVPWPINSSHAEGLYAVCASATPKEADTVLGECRKHLPAYMVPCEILWINQMPLNVNGKMDRNAAAAIVEKHVCQSTEK